MLDAFPPLLTHYSLQRADSQAFATLDELQIFIRRLFPKVKFYWSTSGAEILRQAKEQGIQLPPVIREGYEGCPSLLEGVAEGKDYIGFFSLGHEEPVRRLEVTTRGTATRLDKALAALETLAGAEFRVLDRFRVGE